MTFEEWFKTKGIAHANALDDESIGNKRFAKIVWEAAQANSSSGHTIPLYLSLQTSPDVSVLIDALESITEYWNGDNNQDATHDACQHAVETACDALNAYRQQGGEA